MSVVAVPAVEHVTPARRTFRWTRWIVVGGVAIGLFFALLVPTMCRPRESANRIKCASNLRQLGLAMKSYAADHAGVMPADWDDLARNADLTADAFICPSGDDDRGQPAAVAVWSTKLDDPAAHRCSYRYAGRGLHAGDLTADDVLAFKPANDHADLGVNLLFADGHVDWHPAGPFGRRPEYDRLLADYDAGLRPLRWGTN